MDDQKNSGKIKITITANDSKIDESYTAAKLVISTGVFAYSGNAFDVKAKDLISADDQNEITLGTDEKLYSEKNDGLDFTAYYELSRG